jgi:Zn finger protein HypA/HybF involved in hydrogenase expression
MYAEFIAAIQSAKALGELIKAAHGLSNHLELLTAVNDVQEKLSQALVLNLESAEKQAALSDRIRELEKQIDEMKDWKSQMERYMLFEFPTGTFAYSIKPGMEQDEPFHYLCQNCVSNRQKSILQPQGRCLKCHACKTEIEIHEPPPPLQSPKWINP